MLPDSLFVPGVGLGQLTKTQKGSEVSFCGDAVCSHALSMTQVAGEENFFSRNSDVSQKNYCNVHIQLSGDFFSQSLSAHDKG